MSMDYVVTAIADDEVDATKAPTTISIEAGMKESFVEGVLDDKNFMFLGKKTAQRDELFLFAMALGWRNRLSTELDKPCSGGFIRTSSFSSQMVSMIDLIHFAESEFKTPNVLRDHKESYRMAERYANGGLHLLRGEMDDVSVDSETFANSLIEEMDEMFSEYFGE